MDEKILEILKRLENKIDDNTKDIKNINTKVESIEKKLDGVVEQTADLTEFRSETQNGIEAIKKDVGKLTNVTKTNCFEIADLKAVR